MFVDEACYKYKQIGFSNLQKDFSSSSLSRGLGSLRSHDRLLQVCFRQCYLPMKFGLIPR